METERRFMGFQVPFRLLIELMQEGADPIKLKCIKGVPKDAKFITSYEEKQSSAVVLVFEHPSFPLTEMGSLFPYGQLAYQIVTEVSNAISI